MSAFNILFSSEVFASTLRMMVPLLFVSLGGLLTKQAGIENIGLEGLMLLGCFSGFVTDYFTRSWVMGLIGGMAASMLISLLFGLFVITLRAHEIVAGVAINTLGAGLTTYLLRVLFGVKGAFSDPRVVTIPTANIPILEKSSVLNTILNNQSILFWLMILCAAFVAFLLHRTRFGYYIRACGQNPQALAAAGVDVTRVRYLMLLLHGALCGLGGAYLSIGYLTQYVENMSAGRGFIAMAAIAFGGAEPGKVVFSVLLFAFVESLANRFQSINVPSYFALMIPYVVTVIVLVATSYREMVRKKAVRL